MLDLYRAADDLLSSNRAVRTSELKRLERTIIPQLDESAALEFLQSEMKGKTLGKVLLTIIGDGNAPEICREKAAIILRGCLQKAYGCSHNGTDQLLSAGYLGDFFVDFCETLQARMCPPQSADSAPSSGTSVEPSEEIRLILVNTASDLLTYMDSLALCTTEAKQSRRMLDSSSMLCQAIAKKGLSDPYPELKRECCVVLEKLVKIFPQVVQMHSEGLLQPIIGGSRAYKAVEGLSSGVGLETSRNGATPSLLSTSLVRHRHAKTRCLAIDVSAAILSCCPTGHDSTTWSRDGTLQDTLLHKGVLTCWENEPLFDRSAPVRIAVINAVGKVSRLMAADFAISTEMPANVERHLLPPAPRLLALLLLGMTDGSASISSAASEEFLRLARECMPSAVASEDPERNNDDNDVIRSRLLRVHSSNILTILLHDISWTWASERKVKALNALEVFIGLMGRSIAGTLNNREVSNPCCLVSRASEVMDAMCKCLEDESTTLNATLSCARALGRERSFVAPALGVLLPSLHSSHKHGDASDSNDAASRRRLLLLSEPQHFASALSLLGSLMRGAIYRCVNSPESDSARLDCTRERDVSAALNNVSVLDAASSTKAAAWALLDACEALCEYLPETYFDDKDDVQKSAVAVDTLTCIVHLLGCPDSFGLRRQTLELLDDIAEEHDGIEYRVELMRLHFRDVLFCIRSELSPMDEEISPWEAGDRRLHAFDALLRNSGGCAVGENFDLVAPILEAHLTGAAFEENSSSEQQVDYAVKLSIMALLESIVSDPSFPKESVQPFTAKLLDSVIMPNLVWRVGGMAAALRKVSAAALFSLLRSGSATAEALFVSAPRLLPVLKSNLTDDDASTRELICSSLGIVFELIPGGLGEEAVKQLYPDLIQCLDDSSDSVRFASCGALKYFLKAAPASHFRGATIDFIVDQLLIHMDDPNRDFQNAVMNVLTFALAVDQNVVVEKTLAARSSHRSDEFCSLLLRKADERIATSNLILSLGEGASR